MAGEQPAIWQFISAKRSDDKQLHPLAFDNRSLVPGEPVDKEVAEDEQPLGGETGQPLVHEPSWELCKTWFFVPNRKRGRMAGSRVGPYFATRRVQTRVPVFHKNGGHGVAV